MRRICKKCEKRFTPSIWNQVYCGSKENKLGCSWWNVNQNRSKRRWQNEDYKNYQREYGKKWKKIQRKLNSDYAKRQLETKKKYFSERGGKQKANEWRKRNIEKILFWNKKRILTQKSVVGSHTWDEWQNLKAKYNHSCALCKVPEGKIAEKWEGTHFVKLTEDHIVPIAKGGTNYINNIQPLCISCNAKKKDKKI